MDAKLDEKKLEEIMKQVEDAAKQLEKCDEAKTDEMKEKIEEVKNELEQEKKDAENKDEKKCKERRKSIGKKLESIAGLLGELKNRAFMAVKHGIDEVEVANMSKDEIPLKYRTLVEKYRSSLSKQ